MLTLTLPLPPSANNAFANRKGGGFGRVKSKTHKAWIKNADRYYLLQKLGRMTPITGKYHVTIFMPEDMRGDEDGRVKLAIDWLVKRDLTPDDKHMRGHEVKRDAELHGHIFMIVRSLDELLPEGTNRGSPTGASAAGESVPAPGIVASDAASGG